MKVVDEKNSLLQGFLRWRERHIKDKQETVEGDFERGTGSIAFRVRFPNPDGLLKHGE